MTSFLEWLGQIGLAHCSQVLLENGIDFDVARDLTQDDLRSIGLNLGDSRRLLKAMPGWASRPRRTAVPPDVTDVP